MALPLLPSVIPLAMHVTGYSKTVSPEVADRCVRQIIETASIVYYTHCDGACNPLPPCPSVCRRFSEACPGIVPAFENLALYLFTIKQSAPTEAVAFEDMFIPLTKQLPFCSENSSLNELELANRTLKFFGYNSSTGECSDTERPGSNSSSRVWGNCNPDYIAEFYRNQVGVSKSVLRYNPIPFEDVFAVCFPLAWFLPFFGLILLPLLSQWQPMKRLNLCPRVRWVNPCADKELTRRAVIGSYNIFS